jgi:hypothetical protein
MEALVARVRRCLPRAVWHEAFEQQAGRGVIFEEHLLTLLHIDAAVPLHGEEARQLQRGVRGLAKRHEGKADHTAAPGALILFRQPRNALRMALALQQGDQVPRFRTALHTSVCTVGIFHAQERHWAVILGPQRASVGALAWNSPAGAVAVCPATRRALGGRLDQETPGALVTQTFNGESLVRACITLPPYARELDEPSGEPA